MYFKFTTNQNRTYLLFPLSSQTQGFRLFTLFYKIGILCFTLQRLVTQSLLFLFTYCLLNLWQSENFGIWASLTLIILPLEKVWSRRANVQSNWYTLGALQEALVQCGKSLHLLVGGCLYCCSSKSFRTQDQERWEEDTEIKGTTRRLPPWGYRLNSSKEKGVMLVTLGRKAAAQKPRYPPTTKSENTQRQGREMLLLQQVLSLL